MEAARRGDHRALEGLRLYTRVFRVEALLRRFRLAPWQRERVRQRFTRRALERLAAWALALAPKVEPKSPLGTALTYLQRQWLRLSLFLFDGAVEATNNRSERELRPGVLGQHTWLFCGSDDSAVAWSAGYTLLHSALAHGLNPRAYLHAIVAKLLPGFPRQRLDELLPDAMLRAHPELALPAQVPRGLLPAPASTPTPAQAA